MFFGRAHTHQVVFIAKTEDKEDILWIENLIKEFPDDYALRRNPTDRFVGNYEWIPANQIYVKIDDDVVFIRNGAIEAMLQEFLKGRWFLVSANVINHPLLSFVHARLGALHNSDVPDRSRQLEGSPLANLTYDSFGGCSWKGPMCAYNQHLSLIKNYHAQELDAYDFHLWDFHAFVRFLRVDVDFGRSMSVFRST